ncbi:MAG: hypothetical protein M3Z08_08205 [Chloroflexota bacterium]|nr:hypothetical protein [Chloroflexota bacterium]
MCSGDREGRHDEHRYEISSWRPIMAMLIMAMLIMAMLIMAMLIMATDHGDAHHGDREGRHYT